MGSILCEHCVAACCRYLAIPIDTPSSARDYDDMRWYLMHEGVSIFVEEGDWFFQVQTVCKNLGEDNLCGVYETRPEICSEYKAEGCDYASGEYGYDQLYTHPKQIEAYYEKKTGKKLKSMDRHKATKRNGQARKPRKRKSLVQLQT